MKAGSGLFARTLSHVLWWLLSVPIYVKVLGIGAVVAATFAGITLYTVRSNMAETLYGSLERRTLALADWSCWRLARPMVVDDLFTVHESLGNIMDAFPEVRYMIVLAPDAEIVAHTFPGSVPSDLVRVAIREVPSQGTIQVLGSPEGLVFEATVGILEGSAGTLRLGVTDKVIAGELSSITRSVLVALALCAMIGGGLGLVLTHILTRPLDHLLVATNRISRGDFHGKAEVFSTDEFGKLALAFNQMVEALHQYRQEVQAKEAARIALVEKIVLTQEEERRRVARELHDQLGQSLSTLLMTVKSVTRDDGIPEKICQDIEREISGLIGEVQRLAWDMRPSILDDYGLDSALARYVEESSERFGIPIDYQYICSSKLGRLSSRVEVTLYRIAQEAVTNIIRHAHARRASMVLFQRPDSVTLLVEDEGVGFDLASVRESSNTCLGLIGMEERTALLGGDFVMESAPANGTTIRVTIPTNEEDK